MSDSMHQKSREILKGLADRSVADMEALVRWHNRAYWEKNAPEITDEAFDRLLEALRVAAPNSPLLQELGENRDRRFKTVNHQRPMLSLEKCYDDATLQKWREKVRGPLLAMPKIDGVACTVHFDAEGRLVLAATRGDGKEGDDITANVVMIEDIPAQLSGPAIGPLLAEGVTGVEVRGEVHMKLSHFQAHYAQDFANPRNLSAGALKHKDPDQTQRYGLSFFPYSADGLAAESERDRLRILKSLGFKLIPHLFIEETDESAEAYRHFLEERDRFDFETDGVVLRADRVSEHTRLGETAHHPRWAIAYKFQGESAQTNLEEVVWSVGRTGVITPVAVVSPVYVSGATVTRASLHNLGNLRKLGLKIGAKVELVRRGGVIPYVERVLRAVGQPIEVPLKCPSCQGPVEEDGDFLRCVQADLCSEVVVARLLHFCSVIDLQGFGKKHATTLVQKGLVRGLADFYRLDLEMLLPLERMGEKLATKLLREIDRARQMPFSVFLAALGIDEIGPTVAQTLVEDFPTYPALKSASAEDLAAIHGIGEAIAQALTAALSARAQEIDDLLKEVTLQEPAQILVPKEGELVGKTVVFTGKMATLDRKVAQEKVRAAGGKTPSGVSRELDFLVVGDFGSPLLGEGTLSTKHKKAEGLNHKGAQITIVQEADFLNLLSAIDPKDPNR